MAQLKLDEFQKKINDHLSFVGKHRDEQLDKIVKQNENREEETLRKKSKLTIPDSIDASCVADLQLAQNEENHDMDFSEASGSHKQVN